MRHPHSSGFELPEPGDFVWCRFPEDMRLKPAPKPRPALVLAVGHKDGDVSAPMVRVAAGTSRKTASGQVYPWELLVEHADAPAFQVTGLSYTTKFNIRNTLELPYTSEFFEPAPGRPHGKTPRLGFLHPSYMGALKLAAKAASSTL